MSAGELGGRPWGEARAGAGVRGWARGCGLSGRPVVPGRDRGGASARACGRWGTGAGVGSGGAGVHALLVLVPPGCAVGGAALGSCVEGGGRGPVSGVGSVSGRWRVGSRQVRWARRCAPSRCPRRRAAVGAGAQRGPFGPRGGGAGGGGGGGGTSSGQEGGRLRLRSFGAGAGGPSGPATVGAPYMSGGGAWRCAGGGVSADSGLISGPRSQGSGAEWDAVGP